MAKLSRVRRNPEEKTPEVYDGENRAWIASYRQLKLKEPFFLRIKDEILSEPLLRYSESRDEYYIDQYKRMCEDPERFYDFTSEWSNKRYYRELNKEDRGLRSTCDYVFVCAAIDAQRLGMLAREFYRELIEASLLQMDREGKLATDETLLFVQDNKIPSNSEEIHKSMCKNADKLTFEKFNMEPPEARLFRVWMNSRSAWDGTANAIVSLSSLFISGIVADDGPWIIGDYLPLWLNHEIRRILFQ